MVAPVGGGLVSFFTLFSFFFFFFDFFVTFFAIFSFDVNEFWFDN